MALSLSPSPFILSALLKPVEASLNGLLAMDPVSPGKLKKLSGKTLLVKVDPPSTSIFIEVHNNGLWLKAIAEENPEASITGSVPALLNLLISKDKRQSFFQEGLTLEGNTSFAQALQSLLLELNVDWEYQLSKFFGDIPAQFTSDSVKKASNFAAETQQSMTENIDDYLHEETRFVPRTNEIEEFCKAVDELTLRADRAQARLDLLGSPKSSPQ